MKLSCKSATILALKFYNIAFDMLRNDTNTNTRPWFIIERGKVKHFMGEAYEKLSKKDINEELIEYSNEYLEKAIKSHEESLNILNSVNSIDYSQVRDKWLNDANKDIARLKKTIYKGI